ncbi:BRO family protein [Paenibacillus sp. QZ-Y1]|uniref:BRO family protein n=1 Tax=Paenibacillus sp. QZ-Y1 TaxID=3414511 RepID=UPI003F796051
MANLIKFEGFNVEFLMKEDVNFDFEGEALFHGGQSASVLEYSNTRDALIRHVDEDCKYKIMNSDVVNPDFRKLNNAGEIFLTEDGIFDLIYNSKLPKGKEFKKKVKKVIKQIQTTGHYDETENQIVQIQDETEKKLNLKVYKLKQLLDIDPYDQLVQIQFKDAEKSLELYKQQQEMKAINAKVDQLTEVVDKVQQENELIKQRQLFVCDRTNLDEKVTILANKFFGRNKQIAYGELYRMMKTLGSFDVYSRQKGEWKKINADRISLGKKPFTDNSLKNKCNCIHIIDVHNKWKLASEAYITIETKYTQDNSHSA